MCPRVRDAATPTVLATANGPTTASRTVDLSLGDPMLDHRIEPLLLPDSPAVLSMGRLVNEFGARFVWDPGENPYLHLPDGRVMGLEVEDNVPVMCCPVRWLRSASTTAPWPERVAGLPTAPERVANRYPDGGRVPLWMSNDQEQWTRDFEQWREEQRHARLHDADVPSTRGTAVSDTTSESAYGFFGLAGTAWAVRV